MGSLNVQFIGSYKLLDSLLKDMYQSEKGISDYINDMAEIKNVKICGPRNVVNRIDTSKIYALLDLTDKKAGEHTVDVLICFEDYNNVWAIGSYKTTITIK